ncbi:ABC transporter permease [Pontimonas sp.]|uniref:ABC transporter permease n=1 Tax=Pontimonas sp. TaxID=2304492 RepID=UPI0028706FB4|nr:ABC transporter permease [Pontimonas sp.]MDR9395932.1 ABC transporter permease [Pontimonas sp.]MDR9434091.1 ABC transporter permease [Pontimonas sp.]
MSWVWDNTDAIVRLTIEHVWLSTIPIVLGGLLSVPVGWLANRFRTLRGVILAVVGILYTIPSLALFVLIPPLLGLPFLSPLNVIIALVVYAVAIMSRNAADAFASIDPSALRAATAVGYGPWQRFFQVELPLAGPVLVAGLRVVAVSTVSLVTVGVLVGVQSLGYFFTDGFQRRIEAEILTGIVMTVFVAALFDAALVLAGRLGMPWARLAMARAGQEVS